MKNIITLIVAAALVLITVNAVLGAANPADLTSFERVGGPYLKAGSDDGSWFFCAARPVNKIYMTYYHWQSNNGKTVEDMLVPAYSLSDHLDIGYDLDLKKGQDSEQKLSFDLHGEKFGIGLKLPIATSDDKPEFGARMCSGRLTSYVSIKDGAKPLLGLTYMNRKGQDFVLASDGESTSFRTSWSAGAFRPEIRYQRMSDGDQVIGFAFTLCK